MVVRVRLGLGLAAALLVGVGCGGSADDSAAGPEPTVSVAGTDPVSAPGRTTTTPPPTTAADRPPGPLRVALYGDSLAVEAQDDFGAILTRDGRAEVRVATYGGTAICDFFDRMREDLASFRPDAVVMEFSGNALTPCIDHEPFVPADRYERYHADADAVMALYEPAGIPVYWVGAPMSRSAAERGDPQWATLNDMYADLARHHPTARYVDAGEAVMRDGAYTDVLPCLADEPCAGLTDPVTGAAANRVRSPDGAHFCPVETAPVDGTVPGCPVWSSGAWRYATAMAAALVDDFALDASPAA
jgi:hypothetical protein